MKQTAAGIIIFKYLDNNPLFLGLIALKKFQEKSKGIYDVTKGRIDPGETAYEAAKRECYEEARLIPNKIIEGPFISGALTLWLAYCDKDPVILENPEVGHVEHLGYEWVNPDVMLDNCLDYLRPAIKWAKDIIYNQKHYLLK